MIYALIAVAYVGVSVTNTRRQVKTDDRCWAGLSYFRF